MRDRPGRAIGDPRTETVYLARTGAVPTAPVSLEVEMTREVLNGIVLAAVVLVAAGSVGAQSTTPALTVEEPRIDLGDIRAGSDAVATFVFHNSGPADVKILKAKPS